MRRNGETATRQINKTGGKRFAKLNKPRRSITKMERKRKQFREWSCWQKGSYARFLLQFVMSQARETNIFYQIVGEKISKDARQIHAFHCKNLAQFGSVKSIILHFLGTKMNEKPIFPEQKAESPAISPKNEDAVESSINEKQVYLDRVSITLNLLEKRYLENMLLAQHSPDAEEHLFFELEQCGFCDQEESQFWQQQINCI